jgi:hypothetical protein
MPSVSISDRHHVNPLARRLEVPHPHATGTNQADRNAVVF